jgi:thiosulfate/3-mercaptopyruvate sulfurtransferase
METATCRWSLRSSAWFLVFTAALVISVAAEELPGKLVSTEWLQANLEMPNLRIVDIRSNVKDYWQAHIPGAVYIHPDALRWPDQGVPVKVLPPEALAMMLGKLGVAEDTAIVVCAEGNDFNAPYLIWALDYIGHDAAAMLDGGFSSWQKEGRPVTQNYPRITPTQYPVPSRPRAEVRATMEDVKKAISTGAAVLLDVRPPALYTGEQGAWKRKGHIKGAINHFWADDLDSNGAWKSTEELKKAYAELGATPDKTIITSCGQGQMSSHTYFTLRYILGYSKVKNYDGSFNEWSNFPELPVETGMGKPTPESARTPALDGKKLVEERCTRCHDTTRIYREKRDEAFWQNTIARMIEHGAKLNDAEREAVIRYLISR